MPAYIIVDITVGDPVRYEDYKQLAGPAVAASGGSYLVRGGRSEVLEGDWEPGRLVILKFDSVDAAKAWLDSPKYRAARQIRHEAAKTRMVVVEGV